MGWLASVKLSQLAVMSWISTLVALVSKLLESTNGFVLAVALMQDSVVYQGMGGIHIMYILNWGVSSARGSGHACLGERAFCFPFPRYTSLYIEGLG